MNEKLNEQLKEACERAEEKYHNAYRKFLQDPHDDNLPEQVDFFIAEISPLVAEMERELLVQKEQCRVGDVAFQHLFCTSKGKPMPDWVTERLPNLYTMLEQLSTERTARESAEKACAEMREALVAERSTHGHEHWDRTMQRGLGCYLCIKQLEAGELSLKALQSTAGQSYIHRSELERVQKELEQAKNKADAWDALEPHSRSCLTTINNLSARLETTQKELDGLRLKLADYLKHPSIDGSGVRLSMRRELQYEASKSIATPPTQAKDV